MKIETLVYHSIKNGRGCKFVIKVDYKRSVMSKNVYSFLGIEESNLEESKIEIFGLILLNKAKLFLNCQNFCQNETRDVQVHA